MKLNCIAVDDEPLALKKLVNYIEKTPFLHLVKGCRDAFEASEAINDTTLSIDLIFIDINMPGMNGMDFVKSLNKKPQIIFTTAYSEYAVEGFRVNAVDYLLKPFGYSDFLNAANRVLKKCETIQKAAAGDASTEEVLFIKCDYKMRRIVIKDITYIEGESEYVRIHLSDGSSYLYLSSMRSILEKLPSWLFIRIHRSYIVNLKKIKEVSKSSVFIRANEKDESLQELPIGDLFRDEIKQWYER